MAIITDDTVVSFSEANSLGAAMVKGRDLVELVERQLGNIASGMHCTILEPNGEWKEGSILVRLEFTPTSKTTAAKTVKAPDPEENA